MQNSNDLERLLANKSSRCLQGRLINLPFSVWLIISLTAFFRLFALDHKCSFGITTFGFLFLFGTISIIGSSFLTSESECDLKDSDNFLSYCDDSSWKFSMLFVRCMYDWLFSPASDSICNVFKRRLILFCSFMHFSDKLSGSDASSGFVLADSVPTCATKSFTVSNTNLKLNKANQWNDWLYWLNDWFTYSHQINRFIIY